MTQSNEPIIVASEEQKAEIETNFGALYSEVPSTAADGSYPLRPGVDLLLYVRRPDAPKWAPALIDKGSTIKRQN